MNKIRINVLARELEVKAHELLDKLPELGVAEKKTHSSSIDEDVAEELRRIFGGAAQRSEQASSNGAQAAVVEEDAAPEPAHAEVERFETAQPAVEPSAEERPLARITPQTQRLRPPLASFPAASGPAMPQVPATPPPSAGLASGPVASPVRPIPTGPKPGQILSGPR